MLYTHILVPIDFSAPAQRALHYAIEEARQHQARLTLLHVLHHQPATEVYYVHGTPEVRRGYEAELGELCQARSRRRRRPFVGITMRKS
jgi:nucleotide-binding universal stress UspA family protein